MNRILLVDGDSFFASCEIALDKKLQGRAVWVGGVRLGGLLVRIVRLPHGHAPQLFSQPQRGCIVPGGCNPVGVDFISSGSPRVASRTRQPLYVVFHLPCLASAKREDDAALPRLGERSGAGVIVQPSDLLSPKPSQIHPRFCVPNSNRCQSGVLTTPARICKNESAHIRNYE